MANTTSGAKITPLGRLAQMLGQAGRSLYQAPRDSIVGIDESGWYSPGQPVKPIAPKGIEPRGFQFWGGQNLSYTPRPDAEYTAAQLKTLGTYPMARFIIENTKDLVAGVPWSIRLKAQPGEKRKDREKREQKDSNIARLSKFLERPDGENDWTTWARSLLEDMLVIDAASVLVRKTFAGEIAELRILRGESIVRYIDENGFTPKPPSPAYAQNWWGIPLVDLTSDQLIYRPRNIVPRNTISSQLYGMSPTEQAAEEIQVGINRLAFIASYYTAGSIPDMLQVVPLGVNPEKVAEGMAWMNSELAGNLAKRRQMRMIQGYSEDGKDQVLFPKAEVMADAFDELHIRKLCYAYGASPQRLMRMMNRASAQQTDEAAQEEGERPWIEWLRGVANHIIQIVFGLSDYEMTFDTDREVDIAKMAGVDKTLVDMGEYTRNERREIRGDDPRPEKEAGILGITTATGFVPLDATVPSRSELNPPAAFAARPGEGDPGSPGGPPKPPAASSADPGKKEPPAEKVEAGNLKKKDLSIDPAYVHPDSEQARHAIQHELREMFRRQSVTAAAKARKLLAGILK